VHAGPLENAEEHLNPSGNVAKPDFKHLGPMPFPALNSMFDALIRVPPLVLEGRLRVELTTNRSNCFCSRGCASHAQSTMQLYPSTAPFMTSFPGHRLALSRLDWSW
jgi:hypothetical protein